MSVQDTLKAGHPAPHRDRTSILALLFGLAAGPAAWILQLVLDYGLASYACFPSDQPLEASPPPGWSGEAPLLLAIGLVCLLLALAGLLVSARAWRQSRGEKGGDAHAMIESGRGRTRFMAGCGALASAGFAVAILFSAAEVVGVPACWSIAP